ncbi:ATP-binding protein [Marinicella sp. W31]|uniref:sensor histidine kinase n=1 Tax=Marinicella sp. W31 TaxID=3023713 RepID=UPI00375816CB
MSTEKELKEKLNVLLREEKIDFQQFLELTNELVKFDDENLRFQTDSGTLSHLGKGSIKDNTTAILELVKNSYDADAESVEIEIFIDDDERNNFIRISDNGTGMSEQDVVSNWLRIGFSEKRDQKTSKKQRRKTGEKGIGRLSADRLGSYICLKSKTEKSEVFGLEIDWESFDKQGVDLQLIPFKKVQSSDINLPVTKEKKATSGTEIIIKKLRNNWQQSDLERLYEEISVLISPFKGVEKFSIVINSNLETEFKGEIKQKEHIQPEVSISVMYDGCSDKIVYTLSDKFGISDEGDNFVNWDNIIQKENIQILNDVKKIQPSENKPKCGPVIFDLMFYPVDSNFVKDQKFTLKQLREYLSHNGGIKIYRDNISVKPYGFSTKDGEDWLNLGERQGRNPAGIARQDWMVKNNQVLGAVYISRDDNSELLDSASREGLIHNDAYYDLRALVLSGIRLLELHRHSIYKQINEDKPKRKSTKKILDEYKDELKKLRSELKTLKAEATKNKHTYVLNASSQVSSVIKHTEETEKTIQEVIGENRILGGLATIGIASAVFGHETETAISQFKMANSEAIESLNETPPDVDEALNELKFSKKYAKQVSQWGKFALSRIKRDKRTKRKTNVSKLLNGIINEIQPAYLSSDINITPNLEEVSAKTFPMDIETIVVNLLTNAYSACIKDTETREIKIELKTATIDDVKGFEIVIADSGHGIDDKLRDIVWEPLFTTKTDQQGNASGTGLGLTIVDSIIDELNGIRTVDRDSVLGGARFCIWLPLS